jgi:hypothetical protein
MTVPRAWDNARVYSNAYTVGRRQPAAGRTVQQPVHQRGYADLQCACIVQHVQHAHSSRYTQCNVR